MITILAPDILTPTTVDMPVPRKGDTVHIAGETLTVRSVAWLVAKYLDDGSGKCIRVEVVCERAEIGNCGECGEPIYRDTENRSGDPGLYAHVDSDRHYCYQNPECDEIAYPERAYAHG